MNHLFQVTVYTGQQLVLEGLQRWLARPCAEPEAQRQRRTSIKGLIVLLLKTAATGVLATILDAAIEYRRRQLIAAAGDAEASGSGGSSRFSSLGLGPLTRAGIAAYKSRLLLAIDEMERQAEQYGIEPTHRFSPRKPDPAAAGLAPVPEKASALLTAITDGMEGEEDVAERKAAMTRTVEQLRELVEVGGDDADRALDARVDILLDSILGDPDAGAAILKASKSATRLAPSTSCSSISALTGPASESESEGALTSAVCHICMDHSVRVQVLGCQHDLCFQCARRLINTPDHAVPQCPFCRQPINGFAACTPTCASVVAPPLTL